MKPERSRSSRNAPVGVCCGKAAERGSVKSKNKLCALRTGGRFVCRQNGEQERERLTHGVAPAISKERRYPMAYCIMRVEKRKRAALLYSVAVFKTPVRVRTGVTTLDRH